MNGPLEALGPELWGARSDLSFMGLAVHTRMSVCRLSSGGLILHSPIPPDAGLAEQLAALGPIVAIVAPNTMHHLSVSAWREAAPQARVFVPPGLVAKRSDLDDCERHAEFDASFGTELRRIEVAGIPGLQESLFFHPASRTLIVTDLLFYLPEAKGLTRLFALATRVHARPRCELSVRMLIRDRPAFRRSLAVLRELEIERISLCHHGVVEQQAPGLLGRALDELGVPG